ncbi:O-antigen ligase family protein [Kineococcus auxinigenes]|uniref:O-antigen ligase family protein n=1 Tax=unclassified Kineococcus TaxID=2621656 RepID=UPI003D7D219D
MTPPPLGATGSGEDAAVQAAERLDGVDGPRRPLYLWCLLGVVVCNVFSGHWDTFHLPIGLDRVFFAGAVVLLVLDPWAWRRTRLRFRPVHLAMLAMLVIAVLSAAGHSTLLSTYGLFGLLDRLIVPFLLFCAAPVVFSTPERRDLLLRTLVLLGLYLGVTALLETLHAYSLLFPSYIGDPDVGIQFGRARGPFIASEAMGMACAACGFAAAAAATRFRGGWRALSVLVVLLACVGVMGSLTRSVWVGTVLGVVVAMAGARRTRRLLPLVLGVGAVLVLAMLTFVPGLRETADARAGTTNSLMDRQNTNAAALRIVDAEPLTGVGWMRFIEVSHDWVRQADTYPITNVNIEVHNVVLSRAAELGLPGAAAFLACVLLGPVRSLVQRGYPDDQPDLIAWRSLSSGVVVGWCVTIMLSPASYPLPNSLTWMLAGIALIPHLTAPGFRDATHRPRR